MLSQGYDAETPPLKITLSKKSRRDGELLINNIQLFHLKITNFMIRIYLNSSSPLYQNKKSELWYMLIKRKPPSWWLLNNVKFYVIEICQNPLNTSD